MKALILSFFASLLILPVTDAAAQTAYTQAQIDAAEACDDGRDLAEGESLLCTCKARGFDRFIWGTGPYSGHSDICTAARHAGIITKDAGGAKYRKAAGVFARRASFLAAQADQVFFHLCVALARSHGAHD